MKCRSESNSNSNGNSKLRRRHSPGLRPMNTLERGTGIFRCSKLKKDPASFIPAGRQVASESFSRLHRPKQLPNTFIIHRHVQIRRRDADVGMAGGIADFGGVTER
jgi:hypothetical protein